MKPAKNPMIMRPMMVPSAEISSTAAPAGTGGRASSLLLSDQAMDVMSLADRSWPVLRLMMGGHARIYHVTNGLIGHRFPGRHRCCCSENDGPNWPHCDVLNWPHLRVRS